MRYLQRLTEPPSNGLRRVAIAAAVGVAVATVLPDAMPAPAYAQDASRGTAILEEARTAIGGEQRLAGVTSANHQRQVPTKIGT